MHILFRRRSIRKVYFLYNPLARCLGQNLTFCLPCICLFLFCLPYLNCVRFGWECKAGSSHQWRLKNRLQSILASLISFTFSQGPVVHIGKESHFLNVLPCSPSATQHSWELSCYPASMVDIQNNNVSG